MRKLILFLSVVSYVFSSGHIFIYHRIGDDRYPTTSISTQDLRKELSYIKENNYKVVTLDDFVKKIQANEDVPDDWVAFSIDDGYKSFYENGYPIFKEFNFPFTMFVYVEATNNHYGDFMSWNELKEISDLGDMQYHSYGHHHLASFSEEKLKDDFQKGLELFEKNMGKKAKYFSYPYGEYNDLVKKVTKDFNLTAAFSQNSGAVESFSDLFEIPRLPSTGNTNMASLLNQKGLNATWIEPKSYPSDNILKNIKLKVDKNATKAFLYISGLGQRQVSIKDNIIDIEVNEPLVKDRTRLVVNIKNHISTKLLVKENNDK